MRRDFNSFKKLLLEGELPIWLDVLFFGLIATILSWRFFVPNLGINFTAVLILLSIVANIPVLIEAIRAIVKKSISADVLAGVALVFSFIAREWVSAAFITLMLICARMLHTWSDQKADRALAHLTALRPKVARVKVGSGIVEIPISKINPGDTVVVSLGESVPVDGLIMEGEGLVDQSSITGESLPVFKRVGEKVLSGSILSQGSLTIRAQKVGKYSTIERIIALVEEAGERKSPIMGIADKIAGYYIAGALLVSFVVYFFTKDVSLILSILLVVCADEIAVAIPLAFLMAVAVLAKRGVIIKGAQYLEGFSDVKTLVVDKTGTLTKGKLSVVKLVIDHHVKEDSLNEIAISIASLSRHPSAESIVNFLEKKTKRHEIKHFEETMGKGITAQFNGEKIVLGRLSFIKELKISISEYLQDQISEEEKNGYNTTLLSKDSKVIGFFVIADEIKSNIKNSIDDLRALGIKSVVMLTGDNAVIANRIALDAGVTDVKAGLLPEDKVKEVEKIMKNKDSGLVAVVGDGVNDAAALKRSSIGVVMGQSGSDVALEAADVVLMHDDFSKINETIRMSRFVMEIAKQNFVWWVVINVLGLYLVFTHVLNPTSAAAFNFLTDFIPLFNALRVMYFPKQYVQKVANSV
jgi:Cd2+/Zn2+-exporting ATPase